MQVDVWDTPFGEDEDPCIFLSYIVSAYYAYQETAWRIFKKRIKLISCVITGKDFLLYDIILSKTQWEKFKEFVNSVNYL